MDLGDIIRIVRNRLPIILLPIVVLVGLQLAVAMRATPMYASSAKLLVQAGSTEGILTGIGGANNTQRNASIGRLMETEVRILESALVAEAANKSLGFNATVTGSGNDTSDILTVNAQSDDPIRAAQIANEFSAEYIKFRRGQSIEDFVLAAKELQQKVDSYQLQIDKLVRDSEDPENQVEPFLSNIQVRRQLLQQQQQVFQTKIDSLSVDAALKTGGASVITPAVPTTTPVSPRPLRSAALGFILGAMLGLGVALLLETLDTRLRTRDDVLQQFPSTSVLGEIPFITDIAKRRSGKGALRVFRGKSDATDVGLPPIAAESFRSLRTSLQFVSVQNGMNVIMITSPNPGEGKTTTAINLARVLSQAAKRVIVVDADLRNPRLAEYLGINNDVGFTDMLVGNASLRDAAFIIEGILAVPSGPVPPNPADLLGSPMAKAVFEKIAAVCDYLVIDAPPVLPVTDASVIAQYADISVIVVRSKRTPSHDLERTLETFAQANAPVAGVVINGVEFKRRRGYRYGYGYGYEYDSRSTKGGRTVSAAPANVNSLPLIPEQDVEEIWAEAAGIHTAQHVR